MTPSPRNLLKTPRTLDPRPVRSCLQFGCQERIVNGQFVALFPDSSPGPHTAFWPKTGDFEFSSVNGWILTLPRPESRAHDLAGRLKSLPSSATSWAGSLNGKLQTARCGNGLQAALHRAKRLDGRILRPGDRSHVLDPGQSRPQGALAPFEKETLAPTDGRDRPSPSRFACSIFCGSAFIGLPSPEQGKRLNHKPQNTEHANSEGGSSNEVSASWWQSHCQIRLQMNSASSSSRPVHKRPSVRSDRAPHNRL